jgi:uncharacterized protein (DUF885 family)
VNKHLIKGYLLVLLFMNTQSVKSEPESARAVLAEHAQVILRQRPIWASRLGLDASQLSGDYGRTLGDYSERGMRRWRETIGQLQLQLATLYGRDIDKQTLDILSDLYQRYLGDTATGFGYVNPFGVQRPFIFNQIKHPLKSITTSLTDYIAIDSKQDAHDYLHRLDAFALMAAGITAKYQADLKAGWVAPIILRKKTLAWMQAYMAPAPAAHPLATSFGKHIAQLEELKEAERQSLLARAVSSLETSVYPAFRQAAAALRESLNVGPIGDGIWAQPGGADYYQFVLDREVTTDLSAEEIHRLGVAEVERILAEMNALLDSVGLKTGSVGQRMSTLSYDSRFLFPDSEAGRAQLLSSLNDLVEEISPKIPDYFSVLPTQGIEIRAYPKMGQATAPGGEYHRPPLDGSRPGIYLINLRNMRERASYTLKTLTYHETLPGHHLQIAVAMNRGDQPLLQRIQSITTFSEGWALYAERLAAEMGMYQNDPWGDLGRLQAELWRAVRLVVDTGLHHQRWDRQRAIDYGVAVSGRPLPSVTAEVESIMARPGRALSYKLGMLAILDLRVQAEQELGTRFDIRAFHDLITTGGAMNLSRLRQRVTAWIEAQLNAQTAMPILKVPDA